MYSGEVELISLIDEDIDKEENRLLDLGIKDYFDRIIFSTALHYSDALLTEDRDPMEYMEKRGIQANNRAILMENLYNARVSVCVY